MDECFVYGLCWGVWLCCPTLQRLCFQYLTLVYCVIRSCCENAWLCADVCLFIQRQRSTFYRLCFEQTSHHSSSHFFLSTFFSRQLGLNSDIVFGLEHEREEGRGWENTRGGGGGPLLISQVCSVIISALVRSPYIVSSV